MSRLITDPTPETLESMLHEPVEVIIKPPSSDMGRIYRGLLHKREQYLVRAFGNHAPQVWYDPAADEYGWASIQRLELHQITPDEQQEWMAFEPIAVLLYAHLEATPKPGLFGGSIF